MTDALRYEWTRLRTLRSTWWITGGALVAGIVVSLLFSWGFRSNLRSGAGSGGLRFDAVGGVVVTQLAGTGEVPSMVGFVLAIIGILAWGHEYRYGLVRTSLTALNSRRRLWLAKYLVVGAWVGCWAFVISLVSGLASIPMLHGLAPVFVGETWSVMLRNVVLVVLLTWLAMGLTSVTRSQVFSLVGIFLWPLLVETLLTLFFVLIPALRPHRDVLRFLPFAASRRIVDALGSAGSTFGLPLSPLGGTIVFGVVAAVLVAASCWLFLRRDA